MSEPEQSAQFTVGEWIVVPALDLMRRKGESVTVEPRIMDLLVYLAAHAGETVSTDELAETVWAGRAISDQPVYQGIAQLRKALDDDARHPKYIVTVTKKGYRLIAVVGHSESAPPDNDRQRHLLIPIISLFLAGSYLFFSSSDVSVSRERGILAANQFGSIAILPFVDMSEDGSQQYFGDGLAEEMIHRISAVPDIQVVSRTSSFSFRDGNTSVQEIGEQLGADVILEGSVRRTGSRIRITAQLVNAADGYHLWSQSYEPGIDNAFAIQDQIAGSVMQLLQTGVEGSLLDERPWTDNADSANAYYLGLFHMHKRRAESLNIAIAHFERALSHDPEFALAYATLSDAYFLASDERYGDIPGEHAMRVSREALRQATALAPDLAEVLSLRAGMEYEMFPAEAEALILRALAVNPSYAPAYKHYAFMLEESNRLVEALAATQKAVALDPLSPVLRINLARSYSNLNRHAEAEAAYLTAIELDPDWHAPYFWLGATLPGGQLARSTEWMQKSLTIEGPNARWYPLASMIIDYNHLAMGDYEATERWYQDGENAGMDGWQLVNFHLHLLLAQDRYDEADALLDQWTTSGTKFANPFALGGLYKAVMGKNSDAVTLLQRARSLPGDRGTSNLFDKDYLNWGYIPAVHLARLYLLSGENDRGNELLKESDRYLASFDPATLELPGPKYVIASMHALRGNSDGALLSLQAAIDAGWSNLWFLERDPIFASFTGKREFEGIVNQLKTRLASERQALVQIAEAANKRSN